VCCKKLAQFGKLTKKDEQTLSGVGQSNPPNDQAMQES